MTYPSDPVEVSASDRDLLALSEAATPGPWYFDGWDIFTTVTGEGGHRLVIPLFHETFHAAGRVRKEDAEFVVAAVNAVRERLTTKEADEGLA